MLRVLGKMELGKVHRMSDRDQNRGLRAVRAPAAHEGIGKALRGAYGDTCGSLPPEMASLLNKLS
jgi:hypothetical protein